MRRKADLRHSAGDRWIGLQLSDLDGQSISGDDSLTVPNHLFSNLQRKVIRHRLVKCQDGPRAPTQELIECHRPRAGLNSDFNGKLSQLLRHAFPFCCLEPCRIGKKCEVEGQPP